MKRRTFIAAAIASLAAPGAVAAPAKAPILMGLDLGSGRDLIGFTRVYINPGSMPILANWTCVELPPVVMDSTRDPYPGLALKWPFA